MVIHQGVLCTTLIAQTNINGLWHEVLNILLSCTYIHAASTYLKTEGEVE